jgi:hypothetical protein
MIFVIPIILGAVALITAGVGIASGVDGASKMGEAKNIGNSTLKRYGQRRKSIEKSLKVTQDLAAEYGQLQVHVQLRTIKRFIAFIEKMVKELPQKIQSFLKDSRVFHFSKSMNTKTLHWKQKILRHMVLLLLELRMPQAKAR